MLNTIPWDFPKGGFFFRGIGYALHSQKNKDEQLPAASWEKTNQQTPNACHFALILGKEGEI